MNICFQLPRCMPRSRITGPHGNFMFNILRKCYTVFHSTLTILLFFFLNKLFVLFFLFVLFIIYLLFIFGCVGSSFLCEGPLQLRQAGATPHHGAWASHHRGLPCCGAQAPDAQAQQLWLTGPAAPRHAGSSQTRARTRDPCIGRQTRNHCATREALHFIVEL